jgi:predicted nucleotidyltransferase
MSAVTLFPQDKKGIVEFVDEVTTIDSAELRGVILYGSKARGDATEESDIDLLLIFTEVDERLEGKVAAIANNFALWRDIPLSPRLCSLAWWQDMANGPYPFFNEIFKDGLPVYGEPVIFGPLAHRNATPLYDTAVTA